MFWFKWQKESIRSIARRLKRSPSTISRELRRNTYDFLTLYSPNYAHSQACQRKRKHEQKLVVDAQLRDHVVACLKKGWSPEMIAGRLRREQGKTVVSAEAIYQFIYGKYASRMQLYKLLPHKRSKRGKLGARSTRATLPAGLSIHERSTHVDERKEIGHFEADTLFCSSRSANIGVAIERKTRRVWLAKNKSKHSHIFMQALTDIFAQLPDQICKSVTFDRGSENARHEFLTKAFGTQVYFCDPHSPWQKGQVESINSFIRRFLSHKTNLRKLSLHRLREIEDQINELPRKCLGFLTPNEAWSTCA